VTSRVWKKDTSSVLYITSTNSQTHRCDFWLLTFVHVTNGYCVAIVLVCEAKWQH